MIEDLDDMIHSEGYQIYANETVYSLQDHCINGDYDTDADTMDEYNSEGMFGVTHNDVITSYRNYLNSNYREIIGDCECDDEIADDCEMCQMYKDIIKEIDDLEKWHIDNGSIGEII